MIEALKNTLVRLATSAGETIKRILAPSRTIASAARDMVRTRAELVAENALLRQQLIVLRRQSKRPSFNDGDRLWMVFLASLNPAWRRALHLVQPATLLRWHREMFRLLWRRRSRSPGQQPRRLSPEIIELIVSMAKLNVTWGAERIRGELLKLGILICKRTVQKYMRRARPTGGGRSQTWEVFIKNHAGIWACDFLQLFDATFRPIFAFFVIKHETREVIHVGVTRVPTDRWTAQQLREATPFGDAPRYLIRDNDGKYGQHFKAVAEGSGIKCVRIPPRSPNLNAICERFLGSVRRECLDHVLIINEVHLRRVLQEYVRYFNATRPHQGLGQQVPGARNSKACRLGKPTGQVIALPVLGGLHHDYQWAA